MGSKSKKKGSSSPRDENQTKNGVKTDTKTDIGNDLQKENEDLEGTPEEGKAISQDPIKLSVGMAFLLVKTCETFARLDMEFERYLSGKPVNMAAVSADCQRCIDRTGLSVKQYLDKLSAFACTVDAEIHKRL